VELGTGNGIDLAADYVRRCKSQSKPSVECSALRGLVVVEVTRALQEAEITQDQRATDQALAALDLTEEPEVIIAACRVLGHFADAPGLAAKMWPFVLESPYIQVQRMAAQVLMANPDPNVAEVGRLWIDDHGELTANSPYEEYPDFPAQYAAMGFPKYPGAEWFSPVDSDRSVGWSTKDDVATVARWFGTSLHTDVLDAEKWIAMTNQQALLAFQAMDQSKMTRMQQLIERMGRGDQAAATELEKLQKEMDQAQKDMEAAAKRSVTNAANVPPASAGEARWIVVQKKGERLSRLVAVYPIPGLKRTAIKLIWDLSDYPSAWPKAKR
jgi:hypothetical protein